MNENPPEDDFLDLEDDFRPYERPPDERGERLAHSLRYEDIWLDDPMDAGSPFVPDDSGSTMDSRSNDAGDEILISDEHQPQQAGETEQSWLNDPPPADYNSVPREPILVSENPWLDELPPFEPPFVPVAYIPETKDETVRQSGLAWSAGIIFFSSVAFMLFLGWIADLLLGSSPWGIVGGVILGSIIGFIQFFRITSQIFNSKKAESAMRPLMPRDDDEQ